LASDRATVVLPTQSLPWVAFGPPGGAVQRVLWQSGDSYGGLLRVERGHALPPHVHHQAHHHLYVIDGEAETLGQRLGQGTYVHIPAGVEHGIVGTGPRGATIFYLYLRQDESWNEEGLV
jgi:quercetin dioxygenase-like cupin family protein